MSIKKVILENEIKWEVRYYENGRGSKRVNRRFDKKIDAENHMKDFYQEQKERKNNPFQTKKLSEVTFKEEAAKWLEDGKIRFSTSHVARVSVVLKKILPLWGGSYAG